MNNKDMSVVDHLAELRKRLIWVILHFVITMVIGFIFAESVVEHIKNDPVAAMVSWHVFGLSDALRIYMQVAFIIAITLTLPVLLYHVWRFISPGLVEEERRGVRLYIPFAFLLLLMGIAFGYYILFPMIIGFMTGFSDMMGAEETYGLTHYFQFLFNLILPVSLLFELPIIVLLLTTLRIVNPPILKHFRKYAIFLSVVIAAMITPPDFISNVLVAIPIIILYEFSILLSNIVYKKQLARDAQWDEEFATIDTDDD